MRLDRWKGLDQRTRAILSEAGRHFEGLFLETAVVYWDKHLWPKIRESGIKEIVLAPSEEAQIKEKVASVWSWWKNQLPPGVGKRAIVLATE